MRLANQLYANGLANFINVLDAERSLYQAQDALVQSDQTVTTDVIALYKSLGGGWETIEQPAALALNNQSVKKEINHVLRPFNPVNHVFRARLARRACPPAGH